MTSSVDAPRLERTWRVSVAHSTSATEGRERQYAEISGKPPSGAPTTVEPRTSSRSHPRMGPDDSFSERTVSRGRMSDVVEAARRDPEPIQYAFRCAVDRNGRPPPFNSRSSIEVELERKCAQVRRRCPHHKSERMGDTVRPRRGESTVTIGPKVCLPRRSSRL